MFFHVTFWTQFFYKYFLNDLLSRRSETHISLHIKCRLLLLLLLLSSSSSSSSSSLITGFSSPYFSWTRGDPPPLRLQAPHCTTFVLCVTFLVHVFCSESIECFPGTASKFFLKLLVTIPVVPFITGMIVHFSSTFVVSLYINSCVLTSFPLPFAQHFCLQVLPHLSVCMFSLFCF